MNLRCWNNENWPPRTSLVQCDTVLIEVAHSEQWFPPPPVVTSGEGNSGL